MRTFPGHLETSLVPGNLLPGSSQDTGECFSGWSLMILLLSSGWTSSTFPEVLVSKVSYLFILKNIYLAVLVFIATQGIFSCGINSYSYSWHEALNCSMWDLVPWSGIKPGPTALGAQSLSHWTAREVPAAFDFYIIQFCVFSVTDNFVALSKTAFPSSKVVNIYSYVFSKSFYSFSS